MTDRFRHITLKDSGAGFEGEMSFGGAAGFARFSAGFPLFLIREAWERGCSFEVEADGFGPGMGTHGDWSAIRDSSAAATERMFQKALNHLFPERR